MRAAALLIALLPACGYSAGLQLDPQYNSVGIEIFANETPVRNVERDLHSAMTRVVRNHVRSPLKSPNQADLILRGEILRYRYRRGIRSSENKQLETGLTVVARASIWSPKRQEVVAGPVVSSTQVGFALDSPFGGEEARRRVLNNLAERLVLDLLTSASPQSEAAAPRDQPRR